MNRNRSTVFLLAAAALLVTVDDATAQVDRLRRAARERVEAAVGQQERPAAEAPTPASSSPASSSASAAAASARPGEGAWANYDFVPGERILFADDFGRDRVGNFPQRLQFRSGNMEVVEWQEKRWLRGEGGELIIQLPETLPERFTMEFDLAGHGNGMELNFSSDRRGDGSRLEIGTWYARLRSGSVDAQGELGVRTNDTPTRIRISVDGSYVKLYADEKRALNVPNADLGRSNQVYVFLNGWRADQPRMIGDLRIAAGGRRLYDALEAEGRVATQGILFDTGSDRIRPESTPTLREIVQMLQEHPQLRLKIEGHTDNVGQAAANQALSDKRAGAVRAYLVEAGVEASRLESQGLGDSKPVAPNTTGEGRQQNRRVELVRL